MKYSRCLLLLCFVWPVLPSVVQAQEPETIRVRKESNLVKAVFDNTDGRLFVVDRFGNPRDNKIISYRLYVKSKSETREFSGYTNRLNREALSYLQKQSSAAKLFFTEISAEDDNGHIVKLPDAVEVWFPDCRNCDKKKKR
jgi:hypothetical protein